MLYVTNFQCFSGIVTYNITTSNTLGLNNLKVNCSVAIVDKKLNTVVNNKGCSSSVLVKDAQYWWPYGMNDKPGYLYTMHVSILISHMS